MLPTRDRELRLSRLLSILRFHTFNFGLQSEQVKLLLGNPAFRYCILQYRLPNVDGIALTIDSSRETTNGVPDALFAYE